MKVFVSGCAGFIGSHLVEKLCKEGHEVLGVDCFLPLLYSRAEKERNLNEVATLDNFDFIELDLRYELPKNLLNGIDRIVNLAAMPGLGPSWNSIKDYLDCNALVVANICSASRDLGGIPILHASTSSVYGQIANSDENGPIEPVSPYGISKYTAEQLLQVCGDSWSIPFTILRYFSVYGPRQRPDMAYRRIINSILLKNSIEIYGDGSQMRTNTYVDDIVEVTATALQRNFTGQVFNIGGTQSIQLLEAIQLIESIIEKKARKIFLPKRAGDQVQTTARCDRAQLAFNFKPKVSFEVGIHNQVQWQQNHPILT